MMGSSQWQREQGLHQKDAGWPTTAHRHGRPPPSPGYSSHSVPNWEKRFCHQIPWRDFCDKKKLIHLYPKVLDWDDLAGKEAFDNAKARYLAEVNGLHCNIPSPDPDMFIDEVDHHASIDPGLLEDLYKEPPPPPCPQISNYNPVQITPTGWDVEDPSPTDWAIPRFISTISTYEVNCTSTANGIVDISAPRLTGWSEADNSNLRIHTSESITIEPTGWGDEEDSESTNARDLLGKQSNDASIANNPSVMFLHSANRDVVVEHNAGKHVDSTFGSAEDHNCGWKPRDMLDGSWTWKNDNFWVSGTFSSLEHHECGKSSQDRSYLRNRDRGGSFGSKQMNPWCLDQGYQKNINRRDCSQWKKYAKEQYSWHDKPSLDRGLSCAPVSR